MENMGVKNIKYNMKLGICWLREKCIKVISAQTYFLSEWFFGKYVKVFNNNAAENFSFVIKNKN
ncbi:MAG: hypothetical protein QW046_04950 [Candidatus Micrarchaeaceae archaeon]